MIVHLPSIEDLDKIILSFQKTQESLSESYNCVDESKTYWNDKKYVEFRERFNTDCKEMSEAVNRHEEHINDFKNISAEYFSLNTSNFK